MMYKGLKGLKVGLTVWIVVALFLACTLPTFAQPTATNFGVGDASGYRGTNIVVPVNISNVQSGPVICLIFDIAYNKSVINVSNVQRGTLTSFWDSPTINSNFSWGNRVSLVYDGNVTHALQNGSTGSVILLNFSVIGNAGEKSLMNFTNIQLADTAYKIGTAPAKNGTFTIVVYGSITGQITDIKSTGIDGVTVKLNKSNSSVMKTTTTNGTGYYNFSTIDIGEYIMNFTKQGFWENSTMISIVSGEKKTVNMILWRKGDLNNDGNSVDAGDLAKMKDASVGIITPDWKCDLNTNGVFADAGDLAMMKDASVGNIELL